LLVGGMRRVGHMEEIIKRGAADFVSMSRPFIREPDIVNRFKVGKTEAPTCVYCNKCFAAANELQVYCCKKGRPE
jgi:2,4-dienoyl-CoA reductase-like NADH-dependent reductase (Old Yellow Enzyme family)